MFKQPFLGLLIIAVLFSCKTQTGTTPTGYKYIHHIKNGGPKPKVDEVAYCNVYIYKNDTLITSNIMSGVETAMIPIADPKKAGYQDQPIMDGLMMMSKGDSMTVFHNIDSLKKYAGEMGGEVPNISYRIKLKDIKSKETYEKDLQAMMDEKNKQREVGMKRAVVVEDSLKKYIADYKAGKLKDQIKTTASGLKYLIVKEGTGPMPKPNEMVNAGYHGMMLDGKTFDSSYRRSEPFVFPVGSGQVIPGWDEGFALLKKGSTAILFIPSDLAYGPAGIPQGGIPPNAELAFYVELL